MTDPFEPTKPPAFVSSVRIESSPSHDYVSVWVQGGKAGTLVVGRGQGERIARLLDPVALPDRRPEVTECAHGRLRPGRLCAVCQVVGKRDDDAIQRRAILRSELNDRLNELPDLADALRDVTSEGEARAQGAPPPPLGLMPEWLWREKRIADIRAALKRLGNRCPNPDYVSELTAHCRWLDEYRAFASLPCTPNAVLTIVAEYVPAFGEGPQHVGPFPPALRIVGETPDRLPPKVKLIVKVNPSDYEAAAADMPRMVAKLQELGAVEIECEMRDTLDVDRPGPGRETDPSVREG